MVIHLVRKPGHYVQAGAVVALVSPAGRIDERFDKMIRRAFQIGNGRTPTQDIEYAVNQLTEMAVLAMSPAINDPFTAMTCLDHMADGLVRFIRQGERGSHYYDREGRLCLVLEPVRFAELLSAAFDMLRHASCDNARVLQHMLEVIDLIGQETKSPEALPAAARSRLPDRGGERGWRLDRAGPAGDPVAWPGPTGNAGRRGARGPLAATVSQTLSKKPESCL